MRLADLKLTKKSQDNVRKIKIGTWQGKLAFIYD